MHLKPKVAVSLYYYYYAHHHKFTDFLWGVFPDFLIPLGYSSIQIKAAIGLAYVKEQINLANLEQNHDAPPF